MQDVYNGAHNAKRSWFGQIFYRFAKSPVVLIVHAKTLVNTIVKYSITCVKVKSFTINFGISGDCLGNFILGQLPKRIILDFFQ